MRGDLVLETRSGTIPMWIVVSRVSGVTLMLKTVAIHSGSVERQRGRGLIIVHHVVVALVAVVPLVDVVRLLVAEGVVRAGRGTGTGAALLVAKVHVISDDFPGRHNIATAFLATLLETIKPVVNSIIARLWLRFTQLDIRIKSRFIGIQNILGLFLFGHNVCNHTFVIYPLITFYILGLKPLLKVGYATSKHPLFNLMC